jgi:hypothetical protein
MKYIKEVKRWVTIIMLLPIIVSIPAGILASIIDSDTLEGIMLLHWFALITLPVGILVLFILRIVEKIYQKRAGTVPTESNTVLETPLNMKIVWWMLGIFCLLALPSLIAGLLNA